MSPVLEHKDTNRNGTSIEASMMSTLRFDLYRHHSCFLCNNLSRAAVVWAIHMQIKISILPLFKITKWHAMRPCQIPEENTVNDLTKRKTINMCVILFVRNIFKDFHSVIQNVLNILDCSHVMVRANPLQICPFPLGQLKACRFSLLTLWKSDSYK